jgi:hypothetical protein
MLGHNESYRVSLWEECFFYSISTKSQLFSWNSVDMEILIDFKNDALDVNI